MAVYSELKKKKMQCTMVSPAEFINKHAFWNEKKKMNLSCPKIINHNTMR